jgi:hypothetical protein
LNALPLVTRIPSVYTGILAWEKGPIRMTHCRRCCNFHFYKTFAGF